MKNTIFCSQRIARIIQFWPFMQEQRYLRGFHVISGRLFPRHTFQDDTIQYGMISSWHVSMVSFCQDDLIPIQLASMNLCYQDPEVNFLMRELQYEKKITIERQKGHPKGGLGWTCQGPVMEEGWKHPLPTPILKKHWSHLPGHQFLGGFSSV